MKYRNPQFKSMKEFNKILKDHINLTLTKPIISYKLLDSYFENTMYSYLVILKSKVYFIQYDRLHNKRNIFWAFMDKDCEYKQITGACAYRIFKHYVKEDIDIDFESLGFQKNEADKYEVGIVANEFYYNEKYQNKKIIAYEYDLNSAFPFFAINQPQPFKFLRTNDICKNEKEIGFSEIDGRLEITTSPLFKSDYICELSYNENFKRFFITYYDKKKQAKTKSERDYYKSVINYTIGFFKLTNPFIRANIILNLNDYMANMIEKFKDEVLLSNTDCLITKSDISKYLNIGNEIGQFKIAKEKQGFYMTKLNYQWDNEKPTYRGVPKGWYDEYKKRFKKDFILSENSVKILSRLFNKYQFNLKKFQFEEVTKCND